MSYDDYEAVIGLEIHAQLLTDSKIFCACSTKFGAGDNENACPVCMGLPGALPVVNSRALELSVKTGLALNCEIRNGSVFARKNYFYPDLPKGYQISQYDKPLCEFGYVDFCVGEEKKRVSITRAHMEEDAGKSIHAGEYTLINFNRSSVPLLEIVSGPDMRTPAEAAEYARTVHAILLCLNVCDGNLEEGSMRCDCNVSIRKKGTEKLGTKVELKNINSFRFVEKAIQFEIERQVDCFETGEKIVQETRLYDPDKNRTYTMRKKEEAHDYRYFPDPDLLPIVFERGWVEELKKTIPELPLVRAERLRVQYGLTQQDALALTQSRARADYYEDVVKEIGGDPAKVAKAASNWIMGELLARWSESKKDAENSPVKPAQLAGLIQMIEKGQISGKMAKDVFAEMYDTGFGPEKIVESKGLAQITDVSKIQKIVDEVLKNSPKQVEDFRAGKEKLFGYFVGQAMKLTQGQANPEILNKILNEKLKK